MANALFFGVCMDCSTASSCSYQSNFGFSIGFTALASHVIPMTQRKENVKLLSRRLEKLSWSSASRGCDAARKQAKMEAKIYVSLLSNAWVVSVGWAWKTFVHVLLE